MFSLISPQVSPDQLQLKKTLSLGVLASGSGSNFEAIAKAIKEGKLNAEIKVVVYNRPKAKVKERAKNFGIPSELIDHKKFETREGFEQVILDTLKRYEVEWVIMAGWMRILTPILLNAFPDRVLNLHPSLLPSFPGVHGVEDALKAGVKITGCTVHLARLEVDNGPIIMQAAVPILEDDTPETLHNRIHAQEHLIYPQAIALAAQRLEYN